MKACIILPSVSPFPILEGLAGELLRSGCEVTLIRTRRPERSENSDPFDGLQLTGTRLIEMPRPSYRVDASRFTIASYEVFDWLRTHDGEFDFVHFADAEGLAFFS